VDNILEGSVRKAGNSIRITTQLIRAIDGFHLWSETYNRELDDIFQIQEEIANSVAEKLKLTLEALNLSGGTENIKAYELYLVAKGIRLGSDLNKGIELIDEAISLDQNFALAWAQKSNLHLALAAQVTSPDRASALLDLGFYEAQKTIEIEPNLGKGYLTLGLAHYKRNEFIKAEEAYNKGIELTTEYIDYLEYFLNMHYMSVGYFKKCHALLEEIKRKDPLSSDLFWSYIVNFGCMGDMAHAEIEYNRGKELFGDEWFAGTVFINLMRLLNKDISSLSINEMPKNIVANPIWEKSIKNLKSPEKGLSELCILFGNNNFGSIQLFELAGWAANFGDPELSLRAIEKAVNLQTMGSFSIWTPVMQEVRQLPRFKEFIREIGLVDYWKQYGWPDLCRPVGDDDFVCN
jgi:tetratricopeptide (TPR) repeat protein